MTLTIWLYRLARLSADGRAVKCSIQTGSLKPLARRAKNKAMGRLLFGRRGLLRGSGRRSTTDRSV